MVGGSSIEFRTKKDVGRISRKCVRNQDIQNGIVMEELHSVCTSGSSERMFHFRQVLDTMPDCNAWWAYVSHFNGSIFVGRIM